MLKRNRSESDAAPFKKPRITEGLTPTKSENSKVKVFVRVRPFNSKELQCSCRKIVSVADETSIIFDPEDEEEPFFFRGVAQKGRDITRRVNKNLHFQFDQVFDEDATNLEVFQISTKDIISSIFQGYNCSVFAYGATGAGKTFTMLGTSEQPGIAYLTIVELLEFIEKAKEMKVTLGVSYLEVYNENVKDLLNPSNAVLHLREDGSGGRITVAGLKVKQIDHSDQLFNLLSEGNRNRTQHPTDSNEESSRSHAVFQVHVRIVSNGQVKIAKLSMIDLAGSERASATGCQGARFKEGANINKSLLALGNCINALADGLKHVPYRDSKLTRILKDSLGGNCRTLMIANISPSSSSFEDTYNTLKYATRTKCIKSVITKNVMNESYSIPQYKKMINELQEKISQMQENGIPDLEPWRVRIEEAFEEKKKLCRKILTLQSQAKLTDWRIFKKEQAIALHDKSAKAPCSDRLGVSISQLKARSESIRDRLEDYWPNFILNKEKIAKLEEDINAQNKLTPFLMSIFKEKKHAVEIEEKKIQLEHIEKINRMKSKKNKNLEEVVDKVLPLLNKYHSVLRGYGHITKEYSTEYEEVLRSLDGVKGISWCGDDDEEEENSDSLQLRLNSLDESEADLQNRTKTLTKTILLPSTFPLRQNNILANARTPPQQPKWVGKLKSFNKTAMPLVNKENIRRPIPLTPVAKAKPVAMRLNARPHPYRRTPLKPTAQNKINKLKC